MKKRAWVYTQPPRDYEMAGCPCGNADPQWSEYEGRLWCQRCRVDFVPEHNGVFDGPIPVQCMRLLGVRFDKLILATGRLEPFEY